MEHRQDTPGTLPGPLWGGTPPAHYPHICEHWDTTRTTPGHHRDTQQHATTPETLPRHHWTLILQHHRDTAGKRPGYHCDTTRAPDTTGPALRHRDTAETPQKHHRNITGTSPGQRWDRTITPLRHHWDTTATVTPPGHRRDTKRKKDRGAEPYILRKWTQARTPTV